jgi:hypothetical protein
VTGAFKNMAVSSPSLIFGAARAARRNGSVARMYSGRPTMCFQFAADVSQTPDAKRPPELPRALAADICKAAA